VDISEHRWLTRLMTVCVHEFVSVHGVLARVSDPEIPNKSMSDTMAEEEERDVASCTGATAGSTDGDRYTV